MSEPRLKPETFKQAIVALIAATEDSCHHDNLYWDEAARGVQALWPIFQAEAGGQPPSDGMPSEDMKLAVGEMLRALRCLRLEVASPVVDDMEKRFNRVCEAYAAERGVSAVPPTEEPND